MMSDYTIIAERWSADTSPEFFLLEDGTNATSTSYPNRAAAVRAYRVITGRTDAPPPQPVA